MLSKRLATPSPPSQNVRRCAQPQTRIIADTGLADGSEHFMSAFWRFIAMDDPDTIVLRFLRARKWSPERGVAMLAACIKWRLGACYNLMHCYSCLLI